MFRADYSRRDRTMGDWIHVSGDPDNPIFRIFLVKRPYGHLKYPKVTGLWSLGHWFMEPGHWFMESGHWFMEACLDPRLVYGGMPGSRTGLWRSETGIWSPETGIWSPETGMWSPEASVGPWQYQCRHWVVPLPRYPPVYPTPGTPPPRTVLHAQQAQRALLNA